MLLLSQSRPLLPFPGSLLASGFLAGGTEPTAPAFIHPHPGRRCSDCLEPISRPHAEGCAKESPKHREAKQRKEVRT